MNEYYLKEIEEQKDTFYIKKYNNILGTLILDKDSNETDIYLYLCFDDAKLTKEQMIELTKWLVNYYGKLYYSKKRIVVNLLNKLDLVNLSDIPCKRNKEQTDTSYIINNSKNNLLYTSLAQEMDEAEYTLYDWRAYWQEQLKDENLRLVVDNDTLTNAEKISKYHQISWNNITTKNCKRFITFRSDGNIYFEKNGCENGKFKVYNFNYNILNNGFLFWGNNINKIKVLYTDDNIVYEGGRFKNNREYKINVNRDNLSKVINYVGNEISYDILIEDNLVTKANIFIKTTKGSGKINGNYLIKINPNANLVMEFISRKGKVTDLKELTINGDWDLPITLTNKGFTAEEFDSLMTRIIKLVNKFARLNNKKEIEEEYLKIMDILSYEENIYVGLKEIVEEIPLPTLKNLVYNFINESKIKENKYESRCRGKKHQERER